MRILVVGASSGLGRAFVEGLAHAGHQTIGVSRSVPAFAKNPEAVTQWIAADFRDPAAAADAVLAALTEPIDAVIYNLGVWEPDAFSDDYQFAAQDDAQTLALLTTNIAGPILLLQRLLPQLLLRSRPRVILTGSTSGIPGSGRPEVAFGASKTALSGIAAALREHYRAQRLAVTTLQLGYLNTEDSIAVPRDEAAARGDGELIPVHDVVHVVETALTLSASSYVREIVLPAVADERF